MSHENKRTKINVKRETLKLYYIFYHAPQLRNQQSVRFRTAQKRKWSLAMCPPKKPRDPVHGAHTHTNAIEESNNHEKKTIIQNKKKKLKD